MSYGDYDALMRMVTGRTFNKNYAYCLNEMMVNKLDMLLHNPYYGRNLVARKIIKQTIRKYEYNMLDIINNEASDSEFDETETPDEREERKEREELEMQEKLREREMREKREKQKKYEELLKREDREELERQRERRMLRNAQ